jgi:hypothetical protein
MNENGSFEIVVDTIVGGAPERVWEAVTTGTPAWMFPTDDWPASFPVEERPHHLVSRMDGEDGWFNQLEHVLEPLGDDRTRLHYVHSGIFVDDWDQQYDGASLHTHFYLHTLDQYLRYFDGMPVTFTDIQAPASSAAPDGFTRLISALELDGAVQGERVTVIGPDGAPLDAELDYLTEHFLGLRTGDTLYRFFGRNAWGATVGMTVHDFSGTGRDHAEPWGRYFKSIYA